jgi:hypothetical protein
MMSNEQIKTNARNLLPEQVVRMEKEIVPKKKRKTLLSVAMAVYQKYFTKVTSIHHPLYRIALHVVGLQADPLLLQDRQFRRGAAKQQYGNDEIHAVSGLSLLSNK